MKSALGNLPKEANLKNGYGNYPPAATLLYVADQIKLMFYLEL